VERSDFIRLRKSIAKKSVTELIELLSSDDLRTRFFAEMALRDKTAT
jgi:hypothetical protein